MGKRPTDSPNVQAVAYIRVSTNQQAMFGVSLEAQQSRLEAYCGMCGLSLVSTIREEGVSASVALSDRPGGAQLLALLKQGVGNVVTLKLDRLFRDAEDALRQTRVWDKEGVSLHLVDFGGSSLNSSSALGRMMIGLLAGFAEFERNLIAERTTSALAFKKQHRQVFNHTPFGYRREGNMLVVAPDEQAIVTQVKAWRAEGATLRSIAARLTQENVPTKTGGRWFPSTVSNLLDSTLHE